MHRRKTQERRPSVSQDEKEALEETKSANTLILDFQPPELWENIFLLFKSPDLWYFVKATQADINII